MITDSDSRKAERRARLRFAIIGPLLAAPPSAGELHRALSALAQKSWKHPVSGMPARFSVATLERWYHAAGKARDPVAVLRRRTRSDCGRVRRLPPRLIQALQSRYQAHPGWTVQLHYDNLAARVADDETPGPLPAYGTVRRYMKAQGLHRRRAPKHRTPGAERACERLESREVRSFEAEYTHGLWHLDFHQAPARCSPPRGSG